MRLHLRYILLAVLPFIASTVAAQDVKVWTNGSDSTMTAPVPGEAPESAPGTYDVPDVTGPDLRLYNPLDEPLPSISDYAIERYTPPQAPSGSFRIYSAEDRVMGLMHKNSAMAAYETGVGRFDVATYAGYIKMYSSFMGNHTAFSAGGRIGYRVTDWLTIGGVGQYVPKDSRSIMLYPFAPTTNYGGFVEVMFNKHWGVGAEVKRELMMKNGRWSWETQRTIYPIYRK